MNRLERFIIIFIISVIFYNIFKFMFGIAYETPLTDIEKSLLMLTTITMIGSKSEDFKKD